MINKVVRGWNSTRFTGYAAAAACGTLLIVACAPPLRDPWGLAVSQGIFPADSLEPAFSVPKEVQLDLGILAHAPGSIPVTARLYARPGRQYRLDVFGLLTPVAATWFWTADSAEGGQAREVGEGGEGNWVLVRHDSRQIIFGSGTRLDDKAFPLTIPDVHIVLGTLWGELLPGFPGTSAAFVNDSVTWLHDGLVWNARFDKATGLCLDATSAAVSLRYANHARVAVTSGAGHRSDRVLPRTVQVYSPEKLLLTLDIRKQNDSPVWAKDPFDLKLPEGYDSISIRR